MDDSLPVSVVERLGDLAGEPERVVQRQLALTLEPMTQRLALDVGHDVVKEPTGLTGVEQGQDVGMLQAGGELDLAQESFGAEHSAELRAGAL